MNGCVRVRTNEFIFILINFTKNVRIYQQDQKVALEVIVFSLPIPH